MADMHASTGLQGALRNKTGPLVTQTRVLGTIYQNATNRPMLVKGLAISNQNNGAAADNMVLEISLIAAMTSGVTVEDEFAKSVSITGIGLGGTANLQLSLWTIVPSLYYYRFRGVSGSTALNRVQEIGL